MVSGSETIRHPFDGSAPASRSPHDGQPAGAMAEVVIDPEPTALSQKKALSQKGVSSSASWTSLLAKARAALGTELVTPIMARAALEAAHTA